MTSCEKCWIDAHGDADEYTELVRERNESGNECTPEEQAGPDAGWCPICNRRTVHQVVERCMVKGCDAALRRE